MQNKLLKNPVYRNSDGYNSNGFEQRVSFSSAVGQLLPVYYDFLSPGDKITIRDRMESRTITLDSSVWTDLVDTIDYFFVPIDQIYSLFGSFFYGVDDRKSSFVLSKNNVSRYFPTFNIQSILDQMAATHGIDDVGESISNGFWRLLDCFGISSTQLSKIYIRQSRDLIDDFVHPLTPIFFCAYQKIWRDFYRLDDYSSNNVSSYSLDRFYNNSGLITDFSNVEEGIFTLRHRPWVKDFFKNVFRSPLIPAGFADTSDSSTSLINSQFMSAVNQWLSGQSSFKSISKGDNGSANALGSNTVSIASDAQNINTSLNSGQINTANIRSMFALDKLLEVTRRSGKTYDLQTLAHFGIKTDDFDSDRVFYLGTHESPIMIRDVVATADGTNSGSDPATSIVGDVSGKGYGFKQSGDIKFTAKKHGVLLAIYSCVPKCDYAQLGYDPLNHLMERTDFPIPEFANLGMQPLFSYFGNLSNSTTLEDTDRSTTLTDNNSLTDWSAFDVWQYRYSQFKYKYNRVFGSLMHTERRWKPSQIIYADYLDTNLYNMLIRPTFLNGIVIKDYITDTLITKYLVGSTDPTQFVQELYESDPLLHEFVFDVVKTSKISNYGLPQL